MNRLDGRREAKLRYLDAEFEVLVPGSHVVCAVTGQDIPLDELKYWSVDRQEAYADVLTSAARERELNPRLRKLAG